MVLEQLKVPSQSAATYPSSRRGAKGRAPGTGRFFIVVTASQGCLAFSFEHATATQSCACSHWQRALSVSAVRFPKRNSNKLFTPALPNPCLFSALTALAHHYDITMKQHQGSASLHCNDHSLLTVWYSTLRKKRGHWFVSVVPVCMSASWQSGTTLPVQKKQRYHQRRNSCCTLHEKTKIKRTMLTIYGCITCRDFRVLQRAFKREATNIGKELARQE